MSVTKLDAALQRQLEELEAGGTLKGKETVIAMVKPPEGGHGPRFRLSGYGEKEFLRMNSNSYLGLSFHPDVIAAEERAARNFGAGPGAVRFISGTYETHVALERRLATFHGRGAAMIFSAAYSAVMGILPPLVGSDTFILSDELNHNCIINAIRLARPAAKAIYRHLDMADMEKKLREHVGLAKRAIVVSDGVFSMRGDFVPLHSLVEICRKYEADFEEGIISVVDDSHGVGAFGATGRGTEEYTGARADVLVATMGKALGVNGGYVSASPVVIDFLRETSPFYVYSNPITPSEAAAAGKSLEILDSPAGSLLLERLRELTGRFERGLQQMGYEIIAGEHPIVPLMIRDTRQVAELVDYLFDNDILATGIKFPVVPRGDEEIRFQVSAGHTANDIDYVLDVLKKYKKQQ